MLSIPVSGAALPSSLSLSNIHTTRLFVRLQRWTRDKALSFVPPDGHFTLLDYRFSPSSSSAATRFSNNPLGTTSSVTSTAVGTGTGKDNVAIPFMLKTIVDVGDFGGAFHAESPFFPSSFFHSIHPTSLLR